MAICASGETAGPTGAKVRASVARSRKRGETHLGRSQRCSCWSVEGGQLEPHRPVLLGRATTETRERRRLQLIKRNGDSQRGSARA